MKLFKKILIANRGEIAVRILKTLNRLNIPSVVIYAENDKESLHIEMADESYSIGDGNLQETYLNIDKIISIAKKSGSEAIHPGYGFLSENADFVHACEAAGLIFIGPDVKSMALMGDKIRAREVAEKAGVPITRGFTGSPKEIYKQLSEIQFPVLVKASAGGGGKGMRIVNKKEDLLEALEATSREAATYFGDGTVYIEKFLENPRHIEIQILADKFGNAIHLFERECSIQRRYQKIVEEAPSPTLSDEMRNKMGTAAVNLVKSIYYNNAGTIEFLVDDKMNYYFLEMNTRVQVEHPVSELISGVDIVEEQLYIAAGNKLRIKQDDLQIKGHAIESRIYAEDPENSFMPSPGIISLYGEPIGENIRVDSSINRALEIKSQYDPMISKLIVWGQDRENAIRRMNYALRNYRIQGIKTNISYLIKLFENKQYINNEVSTKFCDIHTKSIIDSLLEEKKIIAYKIPFMVYSLFSIRQNHNLQSENVWNAIGYWRNLMLLKLTIEGEEYSAFLKENAANDFTFEFGDESLTIIIRRLEGSKLDFTIGNEYFTACISENNVGNAYVSLNGLVFEISRKDRLYENLSLSDFMEFSGNSDSKIQSPMPGKIIKINVVRGQKITKGTVLCIVEAMKMENSISSPIDGIVEEIFIETNEMVDGSKELIKIGS